MLQKNKSVGKNLIPLLDLGFSILEVNHTSGDIQVKVQIKSKVLSDRLRDFLSIEHSPEKDKQTTQTKPDPESSGSLITEEKFSELSLQQKLDHLLHLGTISKKKYDNYFQKINDKTTASGLMVYFDKQFKLLHLIHRSAAEKTISSVEHAVYYKRIMSSKLNGFPVIEAEILKMKEAA